MREEALDFWERAQQAFETAQSLQKKDPDAAASRAYYAAFYAVSAFFAHQERFFTKHTALEAAVHRDLVHTALWPEKSGADYSFLMGLRATGDYGGGLHVSPQSAKETVQASHRILKQVHQAYPDIFSLKTSQKISKNQVEKKSKKP